MIIEFTEGVLTINDGTITFLSQPCWPNGTPWADETEARNWAALALASMNDENAPEPPVGP